MFKSMVIFSGKVLSGTILFWLTTFVIFSFFGELITAHLKNSSEMLAQQFSSNIKSELVECTIAPTLTVEGYEERQRQESKEQKEDEESLGLLDFDSEDVKNAIELYLEMTTFKVNC